MTPLSQVFHRRSLTLSILTLLLSLLAASHGLGFGFHFPPPSWAFALRAIVLFVITCVVCIHATVNLVRDVERGYPPGRCSSAAVILMSAFLLLVLSGFQLVNFISLQRTAA
jgi:hypothetical protein